MLDRLARLLLLTILASILFAPPTVAFAHAIVESSVPAANASVSAGEVNIVLTFNSRIDKKRSRIVVLSSDAHETSVAITPDDSENVLQGKAVLNRAGNYHIRWQVLSRDGHITRGIIPFSVSAALPAQ